MGKYTHDDGMSTEDFSESREIFDYGDHETIAAIIHSEKDWIPDQVRNDEPTRRLPSCIEITWGHL